jgi:hypothetical protein
MYAHCDLCLCSYVSTNAAVWEILGKEDPSLLEHLRAHLASDPYLGKSSVWLLDKLLCPFPLIQCSSSYDDAIDPNEALRRRHAATARNNAFSSMRSDSGGIQEFTIESESMRNDARYGGAMEAALRRPRDMPWGLHLIKGWMDTGETAIYTSCFYSFFFFILLAQTFCMKGFLVGCLSTE